jgi:hypothetical protein
VMRSRALDPLLLVAGPLVLAVLELFHPHPGELMALPLDRWLAVHYAQIGLFPLAALGAATLVRGETGFAAALCRVAMFVFACSYVAFDTAAGVITGILVRAAQATSNPEAWRAPIMAVWTHPIVGGAPGTTPLLAVVGTFAWFVGGLAAGVALWRARASWSTIGLTAVAALGLLVFKTHAWPGGPITFGALAAAGACRTWERAREGGRT